jgi:hypothetical protein
MKKLALLGWLALCAACAVPVADSETIEPPVPDVPPEDLVPAASVKGDGAAFDAGLLMDDTAFADPYAMTAQDLQAFFEHTPYGTRSFFADYRHGGHSVAELVAAAAQQHRVSPMVLLVKLQVEMGLVSKTQTPSQYKLDRAMGCGCLSSSNCDSFLGLGEQIDCAARVFRSYLDDLASSGETIAGWSVGRATRSLDHVWVTPASRATAALYTYTPWVQQGYGGNWLFWNVYHKYARHFRDGRPNYHWIGGPCAGSEMCPVDGGICEQQVDGGLCTLPCDRICPDSKAPYTAVTFCVDVGAAQDGPAAGRCLARCDEDLHPASAYPGTEGCRLGFECRLTARFGEPSVLKRVCWPSEWLP